MPVINDGKKQTLYSGPQPNQSSIAVFDTAAELTGAKATKGTMAFALDDSKIYVYNGTAWKSVALS